ncbi:stAR-related lipid transfer protein 5 isoform 2-T2 [Glossophaga mutica]
MQRLRLLTQWVVGKARWGDRRLSPQGEASGGVGRRRLMLGPEGVFHAEVAVIDGSCTLLSGNVAGTGFPAVSVSRGERRLLKVCGTPKRDVSPLRGRTDGAVARAHRTLPLSCLVSAVHLAVRGSRGRRPEGSTGRCKERREGGRQTEEPLERETGPGSRIPKRRPPRPRRQRDKGPGAAAAAAPPGGGDSRRGTRTRGCCRCWSASPPYAPRATEGPSRPGHRPAARASCCPASWRLRGRHGAAEPSRWPPSLEHRWSGARCVGGPAPWGPRGRGAALPNPCACDATDRRGSLVLPPRGGPRGQPGDGVACPPGRPSGKDPGAVPAACSEESTVPTPATPSGSPGAPGPGAGRAGCIGQAGMGGGNKSGREP